MPQQLNEDQLDFAAALLVGNHFAARQIHDSGVDIMPVLRTVRAIGPLFEEVDRPVFDDQGNMKLDGNKQPIMEKVTEPQNKLFLGMVRYVMSSPSIGPFYFQPGKMEEWEKGPSAEDTKAEDDKAPDAGEKTLSHSEFELMAAFKEIKQFIVGNFEEMGSYQASEQALALADGPIINPLAKDDEEAMASQLGEVQLYCQQNYHITDEVLINAAEEKQYTLITASELEDMLQNEDMDPAVRKILENHFHREAPQSTTYLWPGVDPNQPIGALYDAPKQEPLKPENIFTAQPGTYSPYEKEMLPSEPKNNKNKPIANGMK